MLNDVNFIQNVLLQLKDIGHSLFHTFQLQGSEDFKCEQKQPFFSNSVSNDDCLPDYFIRKQRSCCSLFILPLLARL